MNIFEQVFKLFLAVAVTTAVTGCVIEPVIPAQEAQDLIDRGVRALRSGELVRAQRIFELAEASAPSPQSIDGLGCIELLEGNLGDAEEFFRRALDRSAEYMPGVHHLALTADLRGDRPAAEAYYRKVLGYDPFNIRARNDWGVFLARHGGDPAAAAREFQLVDALMEHPIVRNNLRQISEEAYEQP